MRKRIWLIRFLFSNFFICYSLFGHSQPASIDSLISKEQLQATVEFLASDSLKGRLTGRPGSLVAANYIAEEFRKSGIQTLDSTGKYLFHFPVPFIKAGGYNVIGLLPGTEKASELVIFSAHYDHIGTVATRPPFGVAKPPGNRKDSIYNGANDNASGTAALISLARYYGAIKNNKRSILFVAFSGEELGLVGSTHLAASLANPDSVACMINLEMLGRGKYPFLTGSYHSNLLNLLNKELARIDLEKFKKNYFRRDRFVDQDLFERSDNYPFALFRIPAHTVMVTSDYDQFYHTVDDEHHTLNYTLVQQVTQAVAMAMAPIIKGDYSPGRVAVKY